MYVCVGSALKQFNSADASMQSVYCNVERSLWRGHYRHVKGVAICSSGVMRPQRFGALRTTRVDWTKSCWRNWLPLPLFGVVLQLCNQEPERICLFVCLLVGLRGLSYFFPLPLA